MNLLFSKLPANVPSKLMLAAVLSAGLISCSAENGPIGDGSKADLGAADAGDVEGCGDVPGNGMCTENNGVAAVAECFVNDEDGSERVIFEDCMCGAACDITVFQGEEVAYCGDPAADRLGHCATRDGVEIVVFCDSEGVIVEQPCATECLVEDGSNGSAFCR